MNLQILKLSLVSISAFLALSCANIEKGSKKSANISSQSMASTVVELTQSASTSIEADFFNLQVSCTNSEDQFFTYTSGENRVLSGYNPENCTLQLEEFKISLEQSIYTKTDRVYDNGQIFQSGDTLLLVTSSIVESKICDEIDPDCKFSKVRVEVEISEILNENIDLNHSIVIDECELLEDPSQAENCDSPSQGPNQGPKQSPGQSQDPNQSENPNQN